MCRVHKCTLNGYRRNVLEWTTILFAMVAGLCAIVGMRSHDEPLRSYAFIGFVIGFAGLAIVQLVTWMRSRSR
jgi:hypothetical protein